MNISKELLEKAKTAKSAEELLEMAKAENIDITEEEAAKAFAELNKTGELSDEELDNVSGGGCGGIAPKFNINDRVSHKGSGGKEVYGRVVRIGREKYFYVYYVIDDGETTEKAYDGTELTLVGIVGCNPEICKSIR
ncbi:MAG: Nif11-like leader peptide family RiPP precursor [Ruminiclostridium sp.]